MGSGSLFARGSLKKLYRRAGTLDDAVRIAVEALYDAADDDSATGGPDVGRRIWPTVGIVDDDGHPRSSPTTRSPRWSTRSSTRRASTTREVPDDRGMPFYVSPEQLMKDRADFARKGIARGRSVVVLAYDNGIAFVAENPSRALHKISEIYDRIAFAAVGKYNEFENLRVAGVRYADLRGYSYDRSDVTARGLANAYAQTLGTVFTQESKPLRGRDRRRRGRHRRPATDQVYRLTYDGSVADEHGFVAMGGGAEQIEAGLRGAWREGLNLLARRSRLAVGLLGTDPAGGPSRDLSPEQLEVAVLDRHRPRRTFRRITGPLLERLLSSDDPTERRPAGRRRLGRGRPRRLQPRRHDQPADAAPRPRGAARVNTPGRRRIFGIENEYGITCSTGGQRTLTPDEVARYLFRKVVAWGRSSNVFLTQRLAALPRRRLAPRVRHRRVRLGARRSSRTTRRGSGSSRASSSTPSSGCARTAWPATSTSSRTTPTRPATPTAATRTTS